MLADNYRASNQTCEGRKGTKLLLGMHIALLLVAAFLGKCVANEHGMRPAERTGARFRSGDLPAKSVDGMEKWRNSYRNVYLEGGWCKKPILSTPER